MDEGKKPSQEPGDTLSASLKRLVDEQKEAREKRGGSFLVRFRAGQAAKKVAANGSLPLAAENALSDENKDVELSAINPEEPAKPGQHGSGVKRVKSRKGGRHRH